MGSQEVFSNGRRHFGPTEDPAHFEETRYQNILSKERKYYKSQHWYVSKYTMKPIRGRGRCSEIRKTFVRGTSKRESRDKGHGSYQGRRSTNTSSKRIHLPTYLLV